MHFYRSALTVRAKLIAPRLREARALEATVLRTLTGIEANAVVASWRLGDGETLTIALNLTSDTLPFDKQPEGRVIFETPPRTRDLIDEKQLPGYALIAWMTGDVNAFALAHDVRAPTPPGA
jgi:maltooligosyltrehalose trehalohydrolase